MLREKQEDWAEEERARAKGQVRFDSSFSPHAFTHAPLYLLLPPRSLRAPLFAQGNDVPPDETYDDDEPKRKKRKKKKNAEPSYSSSDDEDEDGLKRGKEDPALPVRWCLRLSYAVSFTQSGTELMRLFCFGVQEEVFFRLNEERFHIRWRAQVRSFLAWLRRFVLLTSLAIIRSSFAVLRKNSTTRTSPLSSASSSTSLVTRQTS